MLSTFTGRGAVPPAGDVYTTTLRPRTERFGKASCPRILVPIADQKNAARPA